MFVASFEGKRYCDQVLEGGPWTIGKHYVVVDFFNITSRPLELSFDKIRIWAKVVNLSFNLLCPPWSARIAATVGDIIQLDADAKGYTASECVRARI